MRPNKIEIINLIEHSFKHYNLGDIKKVSRGENVIATFILCSCFIEQISGFRYGVSNKKSFMSFVEAYMKKDYDPKKIRNDLRNKLAHNYSLGPSYALVQRQNYLHMKQNPNRVGQTYLNLENFISDLETAFDKYMADLKSDQSVQKEAIKWFVMHNILGQTI